MSLYGSQGALCSAAGSSTQVTFLTEFGDLPLIRSSVSSGEFGSITVGEAVKGTRENVECNRQGICGESSLSLSVRAMSTSA